MRIPTFVRRGAVSTLILAAIQFSSAARAADHDISITANGFSPSYLEVTVGDRVYWWNDDNELFDDHSTRSYTYPWSSGRIPYGYGVFLDTAKTGTFDYTDDWGFSGNGTLVIKPVGAGPSVFIPATNRVDMIYDAGRDTLYITSSNTVLRYQLASNSFLPPFQLSGNLKGVDISPDGKTLVVADASATSNTWVHVIDLTTGQSKQAFFPPSSASGTFAVAFGGDGAALITSRFPGSGFVPLRRYDPVSGVASIISSFIGQDSMVSCSGDGTTIILAEGNSSGGPFARYDVAARMITRTSGDGWFNYECAASRDGSLFAIPTYGSTFIYNSNFTLVTNIGVYAGQQPIGAAFHPAADAVFFPFAGTNLVRAYSTTDWQILAEFNFQNTFTTPGNHAFGNGRIRISPDGEIIFVTVSGGVRYLRHGLNLPLSHRLQIAGNPGAYGTPSPLSYGTYWLPHGTNLSLSVSNYVVQSNGVAMLSTGWSGTGSASGSGPETQTSFNLMANSSLTWNWIPFGVNGKLETAPGGKQMVLRWPSIAGKLYDVLWSSNPVSGWVPMATNLAATPPANSYTAPVSAGSGFFKVQMK